jgi:arylsulfatase A-like enzyme
MKNRPNILFLFADDQRFDTIQALGNPHIQTPNLDRLARCGTVFTHAHIPGGSVGAVCMPSRAMLHSGMSLFHLQDMGQEIPESVPTLGQLLSEAGYETFGAGKWHNGRAAYQRSFQDGDEIFFGGMADHWNVPSYHYDPNGAYDSMLPEVKDPFNSNEVTLRACDHIHSGEHSTDVLSETALEFLRRPHERPFFAYISFLAPHDPRTMPQRFRDMYNSRDIPLPENFAGGHPFDNGALHIRDEMLAGFPRDPNEVRRHIAEYYSMISHIDFQLGRMLDQLEADGLAENTVVVFAADNGLAVGRHGLFGKQNCYDHSVRIPLLLAGPGIPENKTTDALVYHYDLFPTLCELAGAAIPEAVDGQSLTPILRGERDTAREVLYFAYTNCQRAVRKNGFKLIEYVVEGRHNATQLFDLNNDPSEINNLAEDPAQAQTLADLREELLRQREINDDDDSLAWGSAFWEGVQT